MNADREVVLEDTLQQNITQMKNDAWADIEGLSTQTAAKLARRDKLFETAKQDLEYAAQLNAMLRTTRQFEVDHSDPKKCEDAVAFRSIAADFKANAERFLKTTPYYQYDFPPLVRDLNEITGQDIQFVDDFLPHITIEVSDIFVVKIIFSIEKRPSFIVVHGSSEINRSPFEQSDFRVFRTLAVYFSRALPDFMLKYKERGLIEFVIWLKCYENLYTTPCCKCEQIIERDLTGDLLPPIIRSASTCFQYHIKCAPFEIELPDFGYVTLMSEDQMQEKAAHV